MEDLIFFALHSIAKNMECWNFGIMEIKLPAQHSYISSFQLFLLNFCIIASRVKQFSVLSSEKRRKNNICGRTIPARLALLAWLAWWRAGSLDLVSCKKNHPNIDYTPSNSYPKIYLQNTFTLLGG